MDNLNFKTHFVGKDGFIWWIGQIPDEKSWETQIKNGEGAWGNRYKVRIMGYHPYDDELLKDEDLPWAQVLMPPGNSGSVHRAETVKLAQGDVVIGFFLDGTSAQIPVILGVFANTGEKQRASSGSPSPFGTFSGFSETMKANPDYILKQDETNEARKESQPSPEKRAVNTNDPTDTVYTNTDGKEMITCGGSPIKDIKNSVNNLVDDVRGLKARLDEGNEFARDLIKNKISAATEDIVSKSGKLVSGMIDSSFNQLVPIGQGGLQNLYNGVEGKVFAATKNKAISHIAGVAAQTAMLAPLNVAENLIGCLANNIIADLGSNVEDILNSTVDNVLNFTDCVGDQVVGAITNSVIGKVGDGMSGALGGLDKILGYFDPTGGGFNVENIIRQSTNSIASAVGLRGCNQPPPRPIDNCGYRIGYGPVSAGDADLKSILGNANLANSISNAARLTGFPLDGIQDIAGALDIFNSEMKVPGFKSAISNCYSGLPVVCEPPKIRIFGGGGSGAEAIPIFGNIIGDNRYRTGSVIDIKVTNPGNNYTFPPFVEIVDNCKQGLGGIARATVKDGKVDRVYIVSEGENYPVGDQGEVVVTDVTVINPGSGYKDGDKVIDNIGNEYDVTIRNGFILKVKPLTQLAVDDFPILEATGGSGALFAATVDLRPEYQGEVKQVIDCIS
jgi:hypothetical protein